MIPFDEFVRAQEGNRSATLPYPHLLLWTALEADDSSERSVAQFMTRADAAPAHVAERPLAVLPVKKREGSNAFTLMVTIGRAPNNDIILADRRVSKFHAYLRRVGSVWTLSDANSTNGTRVDEVAVPPERSLQVRSGSRITLGGSIDLEFLEAEDLLERVGGA